jgi:hypothetical protein
LNATLQTDLLAIVTTEQSPEVSRWWLRARLEAAMKRGRLSGEQHDPFAADFPQSDARDLAFETWIERHIELIDARDAGLRRIPVVAAGPIGRGGNIRRFRDAVYEAMADREAVRDHAGEGVEILAVLLDNAAAEAFLKSSSKKAFPGIWQVDRAMRALTAALQASTLDATQQGLLSALRLEHTQLSGELRTRHLDAVRAEEGRRLADQDVQRAAVLFGDEVFIPRPTPMLDASAGERRQLSDDSMARLRGILTDEQWQLVPGTRSVPERE